MKDKLVGGKILHNGSRRESLERCSSWLEFLAVGKDRRDLCGRITKTYGLAGCLNWLLFHIFTCHWTSTWWWKKEN